jgi:3-hydroxymyristoyl/3-hydroxydecanoyl-(acyl carrier protein) dehydratase
VRALSAVTVSTQDALLLDVVHRVREIVHVVRLPDGGISAMVGDPYSLPVIGVLPPLYPEWLGDRSFTEAHGLRFPYVAGEMANGIATTEMVIALGRAGMLGMFGAAGLPRLPPHARGMPLAPSSSPACRYTGSSFPRPPSPPTVAERDVAPGDWYFRAHFFQDPVQPGSLGVEAMVRLLAHLTGGTPVPVLAHRPLMWKYRGQVTPRDRRVVIEVEIVERDGPIVAADAWLWVGDTRIYEVNGLAVRAAEEFIFSPVVDAGTESMGEIPH